MIQMSMLKQQKAKTQLSARQKEDAYHKLAVDRGYYPMIHLMEEFEEMEHYMECSYIKKALDRVTTELKEKGVISARYNIPTKKDEYLKMVEDKKWKFDIDKENEKIQIVKNSIRWVVE